MDRKYIENEHIVERYLAGDLTVREAREFEKYCVDHPEFLNSLPIPVRLKTRLAKRPQEDSETGVFHAIPSSATHAVMDAADDGFDPEEEKHFAHSRSAGGSRSVVIALAVALVATVGGLIMYAMRAGSLEARLEEVQREIASVALQAPGSIRTYRVQPVNAKPEQPTLALGWLNPAQLLDLHIDVSEGKYTQFLLTIDREDGTRVMILRRMTRDSNRELRLGLNSSAFGPGEYLMEIEGYNWRGQTETIGWVRLGLQ